MDKQGLYRKTEDTLGCEMYDNGPIWTSAFCVEHREDWTDGHCPLAVQVADMLVDEIGGGLL